MTTLPEIAGAMELAVKGAFRDLVEEAVRKVEDLISAGSPAEAAREALAVLQLDRAAATPVGAVPDPR